jgi:hypothetical protein
MRKPGPPRPSLRMFERSHDQRWACSAALSSLRSQPGAGVNGVTGARPDPSGGPCPNPPGGRRYTRSLRTCEQDLDEGGGTRHLSGYRVRPIRRSRAGRGSIERPRLTSAGSRTTRLLRIHRQPNTAAPAVRPRYWLRSLRTSEPPTTMVEPHNRVDAERRSDPERVLPARRARRVSLIRPLSTASPVKPETTTVEREFTQREAERTRPELVALLERNRWHLGRLGLRRHRVKRTKLALIQGGKSDDAS